jgi:predicted DNA binding CopG/RHH family protein
MALEPAICTALRPCCVARRIVRRVYAQEARGRANIRLSSKDLEVIQKRALAEGLPYQTLISSLLHKYASGRLKEI